MVYLKKLIKINDGFYLYFNYNDHYTFRHPSYPNWDINVNNENEPYAFVSNRKTNDTVACSFYKKGSQKLAKKLMLLI